MCDHIYNLNTWDSFGCHHKKIIVNKREPNNELKLIHN